MIRIVAEKSVGAMSRVVNPTSHKVGLMGKCSRRCISVQHNPKNSSNMGHIMLSTGLLIFSVISIGKNYFLQRNLQEQESENTELREKLEQKTIRGKEHYVTVIELDLARVQNEKNMWMEMLGSTTLEQVQRLALTRLMICSMEEEGFTNMLKDAQEE